MNFKSLGLRDEILSALNKSGYITPTRIQSTMISNMGFDC
jgi:superfamily II DNA/RNA helicase